MKFIIAFVMTIFFPTLVLGDVIVQKNDPSVVVIRIQGRITKSDLSALKEKASIKGNISFTLDSQGGDLDTALKMGMFIRSKKSLYVMVPENAVCFSSCVFLLAAGPYRTVIGQVGIHRPFFTQDDKTTESEQKTQYKHIESVVKNYFKTVNIPTELFDEMIRIPPSDIKILNNAELKHFGLSEDDPFIKEADATQYARRFGITKTQYYAREAQMKQCEGLNIDETNQCIQKVLGEPLQK